MAGDWIKVEHATPDKPEVGRIADLLNMPADQAFGLVVRFWIWWDRNSRDARVTHAYARSIEAVMRCPGFVAAMTDVGWLDLDEKTGIVTIPNATRHHGNTAKSRALHAERQAKYRDASVTQKVTPARRPSVTTSSPEKRREEVKIKDDVDVKRTVGVPTESQVKDLLQKAAQALKPMPTRPHMTREEQLAAVKAATQGKPAPAPPAPPPPKPKAPKPKPNGAATWNPATDAEVLAEAHRLGVPYPAGSTYAQIKALVRAHMKANP